MLVGSLGAALWMSRRSPHPLLIKCGNKESKIFGDAVIHCFFYIPSTDAVCVCNLGYNHRLEIALVRNSLLHCRRLRVGIKFVMFGGNSWSRA